MENLANAETTRTPEGGPYRRKDVVFRLGRSESPFSSVFESLTTAGVNGVGVREVVVDTRDPERRYMPGHPDADKDGYVAFPRINPAEDMVDLMGASRELPGQRGRHDRRQGHDSAFDRPAALSRGPTDASRLPYKTIPLAEPAQASPGAAKQADFRDLLEGAIGSVEKHRRDAGQAVERFLAGEGERVAHHGAGDPARGAGVRAVPPDAQQGGSGLPGDHADAGLGRDRKGAAPFEQRSAPMKKLLGSLSTGQILTILIVVAAVGAGLFYFTRWRRESDFRPLYTNLAAEDAGAVVEKLKQSGSSYRLSSDGRTVLVPSAEVAELRLSLAAAGLPRNGRIGFELFDKTNFGATEFAEQINYRRALEGELERSVMSLAEVEQARVHLTFPKDSVFLEARQPAKASVMVKLRPGAATGAAERERDQSSGGERGGRSVARGGLRAGYARQPAQPATPGALGRGGTASEAMLEYRQALERDLVAKITTTLEPLLGADKFRASAAVECDFSSGEQSEESFDPARSVMLTSQKTEESTGTSSSAGVPGTASNLPRPTSQPTSTPGGLFRQTENITYQSSRTVRRVKLPQGTLKRMSVAVLVDHERRRAQADATARAVVEPPSPEKLKVIRDLVSGAIGLNAERGDQLMVESLPFETDPVWRCPARRRPPRPRRARPCRPGSKNSEDSRCLFGRVRERRCCCCWRWRLSGWPGAGGAAVSGQRARGIACG